MSSPSALPIGRPITFIAGHFAGKTLRVQLVELQKADTGRKFGSKDRRPLDPPPVVTMQVFEVMNPGTPREEERQLQNLTETASYGFLCFVDLFYARDQEPLSPAKNNMVGPGPFASGSSPSLQVQFTEPGHVRVPRANVARPTYPRATVPMVSSMIAGRRGAVRPPRAGQMPVGAATFAGPAITGPEPATIVNPNSPTAKSEPCTALLNGTSIVSSTSVEYANSVSLMFIFNDLAVHEEGLFRLRYRAFNTFNVALGAAPMPVLAECHGGPFRVYNTKEFPGLRVATDLTKQISLAGVRVNARETERKRRRTSGGSSTLAVLAPAPEPVVQEPEPSFADGHWSSYPFSWPAGA
ncbi:velvet factor-domain-containing protein [Fomitopsis serialis]|uniref:velvet factor-domain-containing protein n=1 Tax=Fomitopsis serialis TaxID=139415 RepID=UPI0020072D46|nr:velvet factor-domain-containing protein [Neoantrodia serialis]KAH9931952.1 velvet factor-domain-containing protein [Neoantrodia serialis]